MAKPGRKTSLTPEKHREIVAGIRAGLTKNSACRAARIDPSTFYMWLRKGEKLVNGRKEPITDYDKALVAFFHDVQAAGSELERFLTSKLLKAVEDGDIGTAKWMLERRYAKNWVLRTHIGVSGSATEDAEDAPIEFVLAAPVKPVAASDSFDSEDTSGKSD